MLGFFRRMTKSKVGIFVGLLLLAVIAIGFAMADLNGLRPGTTGSSGATVATVGDDKITDTALTERIRGDVQQAAQRQPGLDIAQYIARGGFDGSLNRAISDAALRQFAQEHGLVVSDRYVDGQIASLPAFQGLDGRFNQQTFEQTLARARITPQQLRDDIRRATLTRLMLERTIESSFLPQQLALPYASLAKEARTGQVAIVPTAAFPAPAAPTDQQLQAYYTANRARYTVPERRVIRYAIVTPASVTAQSAPSDAEVQAAYRANAARFAPSQTRSISQVVVADQAAANRLAQAVRGGQSLGAAASAIGLEATTYAGQTRGQLAGRTSPAIAEAAFGAQQGAVVGPVRSPLGFVVFRVDAVTQVPGKTLEQARPELVAELAKTKGATALGAIQEKIDGGITDGATFDEIVADAKLSAQATPPITAQGIDPMNPAQPDSGLAPIVEAGFAAEAGDLAANRADRGRWHLRPGRDRRDHARRPAPAGGYPRSGHRAVSSGSGAEGRACGRATDPDQGERRHAARHRGRPVGRPPARTAPGHGVARTTGPTGSAGAAGAVADVFDGAQEAAPDRGTERRRLAAGLSRSHPARRCGRRQGGDNRRRARTGADDRQRICRAVRRGGASAGRREAQRDRHQPRPERTGRRRRIRIAAMTGIEGVAAARAALADGRPALLWTTRVADTETPVAAGLKLMQPGRGDFLLESVEGGSVRGRYSLLGLAPDLVFRAQGHAAAINDRWLTDRTAFADCGEPTLAALRTLVAQCRMDVPAPCPARSPAWSAISAMRRSGWSKTCRGRRTMRWACPT